MRKRKIIDFLLIATVLFAFNAHAELKIISDESMDAANRYFFATFAKNVLNGGSVSDEAASSFGVKPVLMGEQSGSDDVVQSAYMIPGDKFIMVTVNKRANDKVPLTVNVTRYKTEIPFEKIIYRAFDSQKYNGTRIFYMGNKRQNLYTIRHIIEYRKKPKEMVTWNYVRTK